MYLAYKKKKENVPCRVKTKVRATIKIGYYHPVKSFILTREFLFLPNIKDINNLGIRSNIKMMLFLQMFYSVF